MTLRDKILAAAFDRIADLAVDIRDAINDQNAPTRTHDDEDDPQDAAAYTARTWRAAFASDIQAGDLIALDGRHVGAAPGRRALSVTDRRNGEHAHNPFGPPASVITFLLVDLDTDRSHSITVSPDTSLDVVVQAPDCVPADLEADA
jgi:hypothetical protein